MISTPNRGPEKQARPAFTTLLCELGVMLFAVAAWAHSRGTLLGASWEPVLAVALAGLLFGPVKFMFILPERDKARASKGLYVAHLLKTMVLALACAVVAIGVMAVAH